ncbi:hypothetical protein Taro_037150 [Colocasia esculenta]|uniref:Lysosomal Pro-X carboxypeptidase n=1 Tax=Colocasia esculenta TaxID=4460 RepID=A0A843VZM5_COLES|nr:hypothetical protein [Colocasia esculenta]
MGLRLLLPPHNLRRQPWALLLLLVGSLVMCSTASAGAGIEHVQKTMDMDVVLRLSGRPANMTLTAFRNFTYQQTLDHFNYLPSSYTTFPQRYSIDFTHWGGAGTGSPILLYTGAESALEDELAGVGYHVHAAPALRALVVYIEHRYYGLSVPFGSPAAAHKDADTLGYLSVSQALADYAEIIIHIQKMYNARGPVIAVGCSYGGMLSAYFRLKYPHVAHGALSSSGPVLYVNGNLSSRREYYDIISSDFMSISVHCFQTIKSSWAEIDRINRQLGVGELIRIFNPCKPFTDVNPLKNYLRLEYNRYAQYDDPASTPVRRFCRGVDGAPVGTPILERIKAGLDRIHGQRCHNIAAARVKAPGLSGWGWQTCTEIMLPVGPGGGPQSLFEPWPYDFQASRRWCMRKYHVEPRPQWMATAYNITEALEQFGSNIIFANGLRDPYSDGGVLQDISPSIVALTTQEGSHCLDVAYPRPATDPQWLIDQRNEELRIIRGWITTFHSSFNPRDDQ